MSVAFLLAQEANLPGGAETGVGEAVNQSVVITGIVLFGFNLIITEIFFAVVPQRTF